MKFLKYFLLTFIIITTISQINAISKPSMGFGYLANNSKDANYNYLETIFPNSFANSMRNIFDIEVKKPHSINEILKEDNLKLKKKYEPWELAEVIKKIDSDIFIYGNFTLLPNGKIKIVLRYYEKGKNELFTFTNIGRMETEIFKLVDRISEILINYLGDDKIFKTETIAANSRIALLTNAAGHKLNQLYFSFLNRGYKISSLQGNSLFNVITDESINSFKYIYTKNNSFDLLPGIELKKMKFYTGTWAGKNYYKKLKNIKRIIKNYNLDYTVTKKNILEYISRTYKGTIDYLLIIGFNDDLDEAWVRCINIKKKNLIWIQRNIKGDSLLDVSEKIINNLSILPKSLINEKSKSE